MRTSDLYNIVMALWVASISFQLIWHPDWEGDTIRKVV
ncbi:hypothetical protein LCGC14_1614370 [marine sediment metagenome]|uniref:Uncharacterized protein n=1 Tax=marine sediment metagenome TaxID=412755 RepID=A0A0F9I7N4_9ZZZZ